MTTATQNQVQMITDVIVKILLTVITALTLWMVNSLMSMQSDIITIKSDIKYQMLTNVRIEKNSTEIGTLKDRINELEKDLIENSKTIRKN